MWIFGLIHGAICLSESISSHRGLHVSGPDTSLDIMGETECVISTPVEGTVAVLAE